MFEDFLKRISSKRFEMFKEEINSRNFSGLTAYLLVGVFLETCNCIVEIIMANNAKFLFYNFAILAYFIIALVCVRNFVKRSNSHILILFYALVIPLLAIAVVLGSFMDPNRTAITIMVFIGVMPLFILDKPSHIVTLIVTTAILFGICSYLAKPTDIFISDLINIVVYGLIACGVNVFVLAERCDAVEMTARVMNMSQESKVDEIFRNSSEDKQIQILMDRKTPGCMFRIDIASFGEIQSKYGHASGSRIEEDLYTLLQDNFRNSDIIVGMEHGRYAVYALKMNAEEECEGRRESIVSQATNLEIPSAPGVKVYLNISYALNNGSYTDYNTLRRDAESALPSQDVAVEK